MGGKNILSLFDGVSAGQVALERAGIQVNKYLASEIDQDAIKVTQKNYPKTIQLGDVMNWKTWELPKINLLIGGSPCPGFSDNGKGFNDPRSKLFFEYAEVLKHLREKNKYLLFLFENVNMNREWADVVSAHLGVEYIQLDSANVSGQIRRRLYWTNIKNISPLEDRGITLQSILEYNDVALAEKAYCLDANYSKGGIIKNHGSKEFHQLRQSERRVCVKIASPESMKRYAKSRLLPYRILTPVECERLQTLPDNFSEGIDKMKRYKCIGNAWTVDVIAHIFKHIDRKYGTELR